jgi:hypothetical protein
LKPITSAIAPRVPKAVYRLWKYLESLGRYEGWISVGIRHLMAKYHRKESTVKAWFGALFKAGILASKRRGPHPPVYTILIHTFDTCKQFPLFTEHEEPEKEQPLPFPEATITNEYGRTDPNPEFVRLQAILRGAQERVRRARNPAAYERAIIQAELRAMRKPAATAGHSFGAAVERC